MTQGYSEKFDPDVQIATEEKIASMIRHAIEESEDAAGEHDYTLTDEDCADLGRNILAAILLQFRPDLFDAG